MIRYLFLVCFFISACGHSTKLKSTAIATNNPNIYNSEAPSLGLDFSAPLEKIAFGSCANQDKPEPLWKDVEVTNPDVFIFMGDNVYASSPSQQPIAEQYRKLDQIPEYKSLRKKVPFMATWDDHDYGTKDGGADWSGKDSARRDFMNYWTYTKNLLSPKQGGVYHAKIAGPKKKVTQIIMLDTRYFRSPLLIKPGNEGMDSDFAPNLEGTMLGEEQWKWLETQLKQPADLRFIVSSIQLIPNDPKFEKWGNFPKERERFFNLIKTTHAKNVIILSGDRHSASISKMDLKGHGAIYEITASSINKPHTFDDQDSHYLIPVYNKENFGLAKIDWKKKTVNVEIHGLNNEVVSAVDIKLK